MAVLGTYNFTTGFWVHAALALPPVLLGVWALSYRDTRGAKPFVWFAWSMAVFVLAEAFSSAGADAATRLSWHRHILVLPSMAVLSVLAMALGHAGVSRATSRAVLVTCVTVAVLACVAALTNRHHGLFWTRTWVDDAVVVERHVLGKAYFLGINLAMVVAALVFAAQVLRGPRLFRGQAAIMFLGIVALHTGFTAHLAGVSLGLPFRVSFLTNLLACGLFAVGVFRFRLLSVAPIARDRVVESLVDAVVVLDARLRVVDVNRSAAQALGLPREAALGMHAARAFARVPGVEALLEGPAERVLESVSAAQDDPRTYRVLRSDVTDGQDGVLGHVVTFHDVTRERDLQARLVSQAKDLAAQRERQQAAREVHDGLAQVLAYVKLLGQTAQDLLGQGKPAEATEMVARMTHATQDAHQDVRRFLDGATAARADQRPLPVALESLLTGMADRFQLRADLVLEPSGRVDVAAGARGPLLAVVEEALHNARKHAGASHVTVSLSADGTRTAVTVEDDGCGFLTEAPRANHATLGLRLMEERAREAGATLRVESAPGQGTRVTIHLPRPQGEATVP
jgi:signal transduction histidine kinase